MRILRQLVNPFVLVIVLLAVIGLASGCQSETNSKDESGGLYDYPIEPIDIRNVKVTDGFWLPIIKRVQEKTIEFAIAKCQEEGRFDNFLIAGGELEGQVKGAMPFDDTDVYKIIEGASNSLISNPNKELEALLDSLIAIVAVGQEADGYLTTWRTINPGQPPAPWVQVKEPKRWDGLFMSHELYNAGHLYEAAAVHYQATGKRNFLDIALKNADLMVETFGPSKIEAVPGHQIIETGLIKLYRISGKEAYLELAKYFLDGRGNVSMGRDLFGPYSQDHVPVVDQDEVVGHAVRAVYMYAGMTDIAAIYHDTAYSMAIDRLWDNMVSKKLYLTGGIGAIHEGEQFGKNYELPNLTAYSETCAAIGSVYWNQRMFMLRGEKKYYDILERTLYNGLISGISLDGENFFYPNALESDGVYTFNRGTCSRQSWFDCSCCPTNLIRFIPAVPGLIYAKKQDDLYVNLYVGSEASVELVSGSLSIKQETTYPWNGQVQMTISADKQISSKVLMRIPGWVQGKPVPSDLYTYVNNNPRIVTVNVNGESVEKEIENGYLVFDRDWEGETQIDLNFPMGARFVIANEMVEEDKGRVAFENGPIVYAFEEADNPEMADLLYFDNMIETNVDFDSELLEGVNVLRINDGHSTLTGIPYYTWSNRGVGKMKVWIPMETIN